MRFCSIRAGPFVRLGLPALLLLIGAQILSADIITLTLVAGNTALSGGSTPPPYGTISVDVPTVGGAATITVTGAGSYTFGDGAMLGFNVAGSTAGLSVNGPTSIKIVNCCNPQNVDGWGLYQVTIDNKDGWPMSLSSFVLTVNRTGGFASASDLVVNNGMGHPFVAHVFANGGAFTGYATTGVIPEPGTLALIGGGLLGMGIFSRRRLARKG